MMMTLFEDWADRDDENEGVIGEDDAHDDNNGNDGNDEHDDTETVGDALAQLAKTAWIRLGR